MKSKANDDKESHVMSLRMNHEMYEELIDLSEKYQINKSKLLKKAFKEWDLIKKHALEENLIIIGKPFFERLLNFINSDQIKELGKYTADNLGNQIKFQLIGKNREISIEKFLDFFIEGVGKKSFAWFNQIKYKFTDGKDFILFGNHSLNQKFSLYVKTLLKYLIKDFFNYKLDEDACKVSTNTIHLSFRNF